MYRNYRNIALVITAIAGIAALIVCTKDYNPFADLTNARVHVLSWGFDGRDSVPLYSTVNITLVVALREHVDSFSISATNNRYFDDSVVHVTEAPSDREFSFPVTFHDTGLQQITAKTFRTNGEVVTEHRSIRTYQPLKPGTLIGVFDGPITLSTPKVDDKNVLYHWNFNGSYQVSAPTNALRDTLPYFNPSQGTGWLWVTDLDGNHATPFRTFSFSFSDTTKPFIRCLNKGLLRDTIVVSDSLLAFRAYVVDGTNGNVDSSIVNGKPFDIVHAPSHVYTQLFPNIRSYTRATRALEIKVRAIDNVQFKNIAEKTYWAIYDSLGAVTPDVTLTIVIPSDTTSRTSSRLVQTFGTYENVYGKTLSLRLKVNDSLISDSRTVSQKNGFWEWTFNVKDNGNRLIVSAFDPANRVLASDTAMIMYDTTIKDKISPMIYDITANGAPISRGFQTPDDKAVLQIIAFDEGSGIESLTINGTQAAPTNLDHYLWVDTIGPLHHTTQGNKVLVRARDAAGNFQDTLVTIMKNSPPLVSVEPKIPSILCVDSAYTFSFATYDKDNDPVSIITQSVPTGMIVDKSGRITWKPSSSAKRKDSLVFLLFDGFKETERYKWVFTVIDCNTLVVGTRFKTRENNFPSIVQADSETMRQPLLVDSVGIGGLRFFAQLMDRGRDTVLNDTTPLILWRPAAADTGYRRMRVTVGNGIVNFDTLNPIIRVVPHNQFPCSLSYSFTGTLTPLGELDLFTKVQPETLYVTIHDKDDPAIERYTVTMLQNNMRSVEEREKGAFYLSIQPNSFRILDTLRVWVKDLTKTTDSLSLRIRYIQQGANVRPILAKDPGFPPYFCIDSSYGLSLVPFDANGDIVDVQTIHAPATMTVSVRGALSYTPGAAQIGEDSLALRLFDGKEYSPNYSWPIRTVNCQSLPQGVRFQTKTTDFPAMIEAGHDSVAVNLAVRPGTGVAPFAYSARVYNGATIMANSASNRMVWKPQPGDTGLRILGVSVSDKYQRADTINPIITVVPHNQYPCSLSYTYTGPVISPTLLRRMVGPQPDTIRFTIIDKDHPFTEHYIATTSYRNGPTLSNDTLPGTIRNFIAKIGQSALISSPDTFVTTVYDRTGPPFVSKIAVQYMVASPYNIFGTTLFLSADTGVTRTGASFVTAWADTGQGRKILIQNQDVNDYPALVPNAVNGHPALHFTRDSINNGADDVLYCGNFGNWSVSPYTIFVVFNPDMVNTTRQTLISSAGAGSLDLGITCSGYLGIFNEAPLNSCTANATVSSDLPVQPHRWYIATFQSSGIAGATVQVKTWLNGTAASQPLAMTNAVTGSQLQIGAGWYTHNTGTFNGSIASVVMFGRTINDTERQAVERALATKYGILVQ